MPAVILSIAALPNLGKAAYAEEVTALTGGQFTYRVVAGDYLEKIGARFGVAASMIAEDNELENPDLIRPGEELRIYNLHVVPKAAGDGIVINIPQRMLFFFQNGHLVESFPVGLGKPDWPTVRGSFKIAVMERNHPWVVPKSIQEEMAREGQIVRTRVPPGPDNPLGEFWIGLNAPGYGIHSTIAPASVYHFQSHGCIRLHPDDAARLFADIHKGLAVNLVYSPVLMAGDGERVFAEVDADVYDLQPNPLSALHRLAEENKMADKIDWHQAEELVRRHEGVAREVTLVHEDKQ
jgi:L,D-transpeptidase ErfK/SrfK